MEAVKHHYYSQHAAAAPAELAKRVPARRDARSCTGSRRRAISRRRSAVRDPRARDLGAHLISRIRCIWIPLAFVQGFTVFNFTILLHEVVHHTVFRAAAPVAERAARAALRSAERDLREPVHALAPRPPRGAGFERGRPEAPSPVTEGQRALVQAALLHAGALPDLLPRRAPRIVDLPGCAAAQTIACERAALPLVFISTAIAVLWYAFGFTRPLATSIIPVFFVFPIAFTLNRLGQHYDIDPDDPAKWGTLMRGHWFWDFAFLNSNYPLHHRQDPGRRAVADLPAEGVRRLRIRRRGRTQDRDDDLGGLRLDRLGGEWRGLQRPLDRSLPDRSPTRGLGRRRGPVHLRLLCPDRYRRPGRRRLYAERHLVVRQWLRPCELGLSRRLHHTGWAPSRPSRALSSWCRSPTVEIVDNWFVCGLAGTGSKDIVARDVFVPAHRVLLFSDARSGTAPGAKHHRNPLYRMPLLIHGASMLASTAVGAARGALDAYLEMTTTRKTRGALAGGQLPMVEFATIQLRYAEAAAAVESAELILLTDMRNMTQKLYAGEEITVADRIRCRRNQAWVTKLAVQAVEALNASTGGYGLHLSNPVQRAWRDANAVARHVSLNWDAVGTMYGQHAFGLEPRGSVLG